MNRSVKMVMATAVITLLSWPWASVANEDSGSWNVELQFSSYKPRIDSQFSRESGDVNPPYEEAFGTGNELMIAMTAERIVFNRFGTLSIGMGIGYWNVSGSAVQADPNAVTEAADKTELSIYPTFAQVTYRFDVLSEYLPLVPVARAGFDYYLWRIFDGSGEVARFGDGTDAQGGTQGYHYTIGAHLLVDFLDTEMAEDFRRDAGVHNSYLTLEYRMTQVDDFGATDSFRLGDDTFFIGLAMEL